jgi:hypothetical protein
VGEEVAADPPSWDAFRDEAFAALKAAQDRLMADFQLGSWPRWGADQATGLLTFSNDAGQAGVVAEFSAAGSVSSSTGTWLWSWANPTLLDSVKGPMERVRAYGEARGWEKLTTPNWPGDESDGWAMAAVTARILGADGAYRAPDERGALFMTLHRVRRV